MNVEFTLNGWKDYTYWVANDREILKRINRLVDDCLRDPTDGIGKPEPLRHQLSGLYSRRITDEHRLVYAVTDTSIQILSARYHY